MDFWFGALEHCKNFDRFVFSARHFVFDRASKHHGRRCAKLFQIEIIRLLPAATFAMLYPSSHLFERSEPQAPQVAPPQRQSVCWAWQTKTIKDLHDNAKDWSWTQINGPLNWKACRNPNNSKAMLISDDVSMSSKLCQWAGDLILTAWKIKACQTQAKDGKKGFYEWFQVFLDNSKTEREDVATSC